LIVIKRGAKGFESGRNLKKIGWHAQDTSELFLTTSGAQLPICWVLTVIDFIY
tara:strand:+ start:295 stop:453 length:159 start_codon:yes stop_codon:yes gene_type:complete